MTNKLTRLTRIIDLHNGKYIQIVASPHKVTLCMFPIEAVIADGLYNYARANVSSIADNYLAGIKDCAEVAWPGIIAKVADSDASDYYAYYDSKYDVEHELEGLHSIIQVTGYKQDSMACYDFNKRRMQSYLFDLMEERNDD